MYSIKCVIKILSIIYIYINKILKIYIYIERERESRISKIGEIIKL